MKMKKQQWKQTNFQNFEYSDFKITQKPNSNRSQAKQCIKIR